MFDISNLEELNDDNSDTGQLDNISNNQDEIQTIDLDLIYPNPNQPRKHFDNEKLEELAQTIKKHGLLQPIVLKKDGNNKYMIIAGERRFKAHKLNKALTIKSIISSKNVQVDEVALIENIQRDDLNPFEIASSIKSLWESNKYDSKSKLSKAVGKSASYISKVFAIFNLQDKIIKELAETNSSIGLEILQELSRIKDEQDQYDYFSSYIKGIYTREDIREHLKNIKEDEEKYQTKFDKKDYKEKIQRDIENGGRWTNENFFRCYAGECLFFYNEDDIKMIDTWIEASQKKNAEMITYKSIGFLMYEIIKLDNDVYQSYQIKEKEYFKALVNEVKTKLKEKQKELSKSEELKLLEEYKFEGYILSKTKQFIYHFEDEKIYYLFDKSLASDFNSIGLSLEDEIINNEEKKTYLPVEVQELILTDQQEKQKENIQYKYSVFQTNKDKDCSLMLSIEKLNYSQQAEINKDIEALRHKCEMLSLGRFPQTVEETMVSKGKMSALNSKVKCFHDCTIEKDKKGNTTFISSNNATINISVPTDWFMLKSQYNIYIEEK